MDAEGALSDEDTSDTSELSYDDEELTFEQSILRANAADGVAADEEFGSFVSRRFAVENPGNSRLWVLSKRASRAARFNEVAAEVWKTALGQEMAATRINEARRLPVLDWRRNNTSPLLGDDAERRWEVLAPYVKSRKLLHPRECVWHSHDAVDRVAPDSLTTAVGRVWTTWATVGPVGWGKGVLWCLSCSVNYPGPVGTAAQLASIWDQTPENDRLRVGEWEKRVMDNAK